MEQWGIVIISIADESMHVHEFEGLGFDRSTGGRYVFVGLLSLKIKDFTPESMAFYLIQHCLVLNWFTIFM